MRGKLSVLWSTQPGLAESLGGESAITICAVVILKLVFRFSRIGLRPASAAAVIAVFAARLSVAAPALRTVALTNQTAPQTSTGTYFSDFITPVLDNAGRTAFVGTLAGAGVTNANNEGLWSEGSGALSLLARRGSQSPGTPAGANFLELGEHMNASGQVAFYGSLFGDGVDGSNNRGIWSERTGALGLVSRTGNHAPGTTDDVRFRDYLALLWNDAGDAAFRATLDGASINADNGEGIWAETNGQLAMAARSGSEVPGVGGGVRYVQFSDPVFNNSAQVGFAATLSGNGVDSTNNRALLFRSSGVSELIARAGNQAPGTPAGVQFRYFYDPALNDAGKLAFSALLDGPGIGATNSVGIWAKAAGGLELVLRSGGHAPGTATEVVFAAMDSPVLNAGGHMAFTARVAGSSVTTANDIGIWSDGSGALGMIAREGSQAPGVPGLGLFNSLFSPSMNEAEQVAFAATLRSGFGIDATNNYGIWATDRSGALRLIARTGDLLEVAPFDLRKISSLGFVGNTGNQDGRASRFNDRGELAFYAHFTDGSAGVFVSRLVAVPEPGAALIVALGLTFFCAVIYRTR